MNSVFGKSMENVWKRTRVLLLISKPTQALKLIAKNTYKRSIVFDDNLGVIVKIPWFRKDLYFSIVWKKFQNEPPKVSNLIQTIRMDNIS